MTDSKQYQLIFENWRIYNSSTIDEVSRFVYSGSAADPDDPLKVWDSETVTSKLNPEITGSGGEVEDITPGEMAKMGATIAGLAAVQAGAENIGSLLKSAIGLVMSTLKGILGVAAIPFKLASKIVSVLGKGFFKSAASIAAALRGRGALGALLSTAGFVVKAAAIGAVSVALYKVYQYIKGEIPAEAVENPEGPGTREFSDAILAGLQTLSIQSWEAASPELKCAFCKTNPDKQYPEVHQADLPVGYKDSPTYKKQQAALGKAKKTPALQCKNILKTCGSGKIQGRNTLTQKPLSGEVSIIKNTGIQHNLTGEGKQMGEEFVKVLQDLGITNKYTLAGALAVAGKESGFIGTAEKGGYSEGKLAAGGSGVPSRIKKVFAHQNVELTTDLIKQLAGGRGNEVALFNIAYGYKPFSGYSTYHGDKYISHSKYPVVVDGKINRRLYGVEGKSLSGYKFRGRGLIQITFRETYKRMAGIAKLNVAAVLKQPNILVTDPSIGIKMSAAFIKNGNIKGKKNMFDGREPASLAEGIQLVARIVAGVHTRSFPTGAYNNAVRKANRHIRIAAEQVASK